MKHLEAGFVARPTPAASAMVSIGVLLLPSVSRDRYRDEFNAELCALPFGRQLAQAGGLLICAPALRRALKERKMSMTLQPAKHLICRIGKHRYLLIDDENPEDRRIHHLECRYCGKVKDPGPSYTPTDGSWMTRGSLGGW